MSNTRLSNMPWRGVALAVLSLCQVFAWADPLVETREVIFTGEGSTISDKAAQLQTPAAMYEYVRNTHEYALYHGSRQNSINTFLGQRGSDVDIASVLIAMYRSQNMPARYVKGTIRTTEAALVNWLGVKDISLAKAIMRNQGIQGVSPYPTNNGQFVEFEHVWVQVQVPYDDYRGATPGNVNCTSTPDRCAWIDVAPGFKQRQYHNQDIDVYNVVNFDYDRYYNAIRNDDPDYRDKNPLEIYEEQILDYLATNHPGKTLEDVADPGTIVPVDDGILPASLPFEVMGSVSTYDAIVDHDTANNPDWAKFLNGNFNIVAQTTGGGTLNITTGIGGPHALADLSTKRLTVTYSSIAINGEADRVEVRLDGEVIATPFTTGGSLQFPIGTPFTMTFDLDGAPGIDGGADNVIEADYNNLIVGGYYLIGTGGDTSNWSQVHRAADQLLAANEQFPIVNNSSGVPYVDANGNGAIDGSESRLLDSPDAQDALTGGLLEVAMRQYYTQFVEQSRRLDTLNHVISPIEGFVGVVSSTFEVEYLDNTAFSVMPGGLLIDMKGVKFNGNWVDDQPETYANDHFELMGHLGSSLEHEIWQQITGFDAVSTVRGIQMALANGASLQRPENTGSSNNMASQFGSFRFDNNPSGFTYTPFTVFGTNPATWTHASDGAQMEVLKRDITTADTSLDRALVNYQYSTNGGLYGWVSCVDDFENQLLSLPSNQTVNPFTFCDGTQYSGQVSTVLSQIETNFLTNIIPNNIGQQIFDFFDQNEGFDRLAHVYRSLPLVTDEHSGSRIQDIRDDVALGDEILIDGQNARWEYVIPARKTEGALFRFTVFLEKIFSAASGNLASQSYSISNDVFLAGGGWVDGAESLDPATALPGTSVVQPTFNNEIFSDVLLVSQANNDLVKTPSTADPISTVTGNMYHDETDFTIKGRGLDYVFTRSYNSGPARSNQQSALGYGWTHSYNMSLRSNDYGNCPDCAPGSGAGQAPENGNGVTASITYVDERGGEHNYLRNESTGAITPPPGGFDSLQLNTPSSGLHTLAFRNGVRYVFSGPSNLTTVAGQSARLSYIEDPYNNRLTLNYDGSGRLSSVTDNLSISGRNGLTFSYAGSSSLIQSVSDWSGRTWQFAYNNSRLISVTNPLNDTLTYTYHGGSNLLHEMILPEDRGGQQVKNVFTYYRNNKAFTQKNGLGQGETVDYDLYRQRTQITDARGFVRTHSYDKANGALLKLEEPDGAILRFENNADGLRYTKRDGLGFLTQYSFQTNRSISANASNNNGLVSREIDPLNQTVDYSYGIYDQPTTVTDKRGTPLTRIYYTTTNASTGAVAGKLQEIRTTLNGSANVVLESYTYYANTGHPAFGQVQQRIERIDPAQPSRQRITDYVYDSTGINLQSQTVSGATSGGSITTTYTYDNLGRMRSRTLPRRTSATDATLINITTYYGYDSLNRVTNVSLADGIQSINTVYDSNGKIASEWVQYNTTETPPSGCDRPKSFYSVCVYQRNTYDAADRLIQTTDILGHSATFDYDANGNVIKQTDANGHSTRFEYDGLNRLTATVDANGHRSESTYDLAGRLVAATDANGNTLRFEYDALGRQTKVITPLGFETDTQYDPNNNVTGVLDANATTSGSHPRNSQNVSLSNEYDELNRLTRSVDALNGETRYTFDLLGNTTSITDAEGQVTTFVYDDLGRLVETIDPIVESGTDVTDRVLLHDQAGNILLTEDRSGRQRRHTYDVLNRLTLTEYLQDGSQDSRAYNGFGDLTQLANGDVTYTYSYTARHELASKTDSRQNRSLNWTYDPVGNVVTKTDYQNEVTTYQYDSTNRLVAMRNPAYLQVSYHYDPAGRLLNRILSNKAQTNYRYDADNRLTQLQNISANGTVVETLNYQHDALGNITQIQNSVSNKITDYVYDALYRLTNVNSTINSEDRSYTYDRVGNRQTETNNGTIYYYTYNPAGFGSAPLGNRLHNIRTGSGTGSVYRQFIYDQAGRVTQKQNGSGQTIYSITYNGKGRADQINGVSFEYDPNDYRIQNGNTLHYLEGEHLEASYSASGTLENKYFRGVIIDEIVNGFTYNSSDPNDWTNTTFHHDHLNSVTAETGHTGTTEASTAYDAFGVPTSLALPGTDNTLLYTGREHDQSTGLYYYRARYYDPEAGGRFLSEDPLGFAAGINFYAYVNNNPMNFNDPMGEDGINVGITLNLFGEGLTNTLSIRFPGVTDEPFDIQLQTGLTPGIISQTIIGQLDPENPFANSEGFMVGRGSINIGYDFASNQGSGVNLNVDHAAGAGLLGATATTQNLMDPNAPPIPSSFEINLGPQLGATVAPELEFTASGRDLVNAVGDAFSFSSESAGGGFVLYPSRPNNNMVQQVYRK